MAVAGQPGEHCVLVAHRDVQNVDKADFAVLLARVVAALEDAEVQQVRGSNAETRQNGGAQGVGRMAEWKSEFGDADHGRDLAGDTGRGECRPALYTRSARPRTAGCVTLACERQGTLELLENTPLLPSRRNTGISISHVPPSALKRIMHVDDDDAIRAVTQVALERVGDFTLLSCSSGAEALQCANTLHRK